MSFRILNFLKSFIFILPLISLSNTVVLAGPNQTVEQRLDRLDKVLKNQILGEQTLLIEQIKQELTDLRELVEEQDHQLTLIKQRQRNLYQDIDRRLNDLEIKGGASSKASSSSVIPVVGNSASSVPPPGGESTAKDVTKTSASAAPVAGDKNGKTAYKQAFNILKEGKYQQAIIAFNTFQKDYPESIYGDNAQYWLGEAYSASRDYKTALGEFQKVVSQYPDSDKVEGAMLKIGYTYYEMREWALAKSALELVINQYPNSTVTRTAKERLQRMKREGH